MLCQRIDIFYLCLIDVERYLRQQLGQCQLMKQFSESIKHTGRIYHLRAHLLNMSRDSRLIMVVDISNQTDQVSRIDQTEHRIDSGIVQCSLTKSNGLIGQR